MELTKNQIKALLLFAGKQDIRHYLNGVAVINGERLAASDGHRLIQIKHDCEGFPADATVIIPRHFLERVIKALPAKAQAAIAFDGTTIRETSTGLTATPVDARYPDLGRVSPFDKLGNLVPSTVTCNPDYLVDAREARRFWFGVVPLALHMQCRASAFDTIAQRDSESAVAYVDRVTSGKEVHWTDGTMQITIMPVRR